MNDRRSLRRALHEAGLRADDAATAADIAVSHLRGRRDALIIAARVAKLSMRQIAKVFAVDVAIVHRVLTRAASESTPKPSTISVDATSRECRGDDGPNNLGSAG